MKYLTNIRILECLHLHFILKVYYRYFSKRTLLLRKCDRTDLEQMKHFRVGCRGSIYPFYIAAY